MKLLELKLRNFASYSTAEWSFDVPSPVFVSGRTGAGKTTLFVDAVLAALYGVAYGSPRLLFKAVSAGAASARVDLKFEVGGRVYRVVRELKLRPRPSSSAYLYEVSEDGRERVLAVSPREVDRQVTKLVGLGPEPLLLSSVVRQGEVQKLMQSTPAERRKYLLEMFGIAFDKLREEAKERLKEAEVELRGLETEASSLKERLKGVDEASLKERLIQLDDQLAGLRDRRREVAERVGELERALESVSRELGAVEKELADAQKAAAELSDMAKRLESARKELEEAEALVLKHGERKVQKLADLRKALHEAKLLGGKLESLSESISEAERELASLEEAESRLKELEAELSALQPRLRDLEVVEAELSAVGGEVAAVEAERRRAQEMLSALAEAVECPLCGSPLTGETRAEREEHLRAEISSLDERLAELRSAKQTLEATLRELKSAAERAATLERDAAALKSKVADYASRKERLEALKSERARIAAEYEKLCAFIEGELGVPIEGAEPVLAELERAAEAMARAKPLRDLVASLEGKLAGLTALTSKIPELSEEKRRLESERAALSSELAKLRAEYESVSDELARAESEKRELRRLLEEASAVASRLDELGKRIEAKKVDAVAYDLLAKQVFHDKGVPSLLLKRYLGVIESYARDFLSKFAPNLDLRVELTGDRLEVSVLDRSRVRPYETYSGGESVLIGFALRLAVGRALAEILGGRRPRFLIIDEGFGPLDEELRAKVADAIGSLVEEFEQIYVISHLPDIGESAAFATRVVVERDERGLSRVMVAS